MILLRASDSIGLKFKCCRSIFTFYWKSIMLYITTVVVGIFGVQSICIGNNYVQL